VALRVAEVARPEISFAPNGHLPDHLEACPIAIIMERERMKFVWGMERLGDRFEYLPHNRDFWRVWGPKHMPECTCEPSMGVLVELKPRPAHTNGNGHKNGVIKLHYQHRLTAPIYSQLRERLSVWAYKTTGDIAVVDADLDVLAKMCGNRSKSVLDTLLAFETKRHSSSSDHGISPGHSKPSRSSSSSS
jgi:hypothetical protein